MGIAKIQGLNISATRMSGFTNFSDLVNLSSMRSAKSKNFETIRSCKKFKPQCGFCKEKLGLLNDDVFAKSQEVSK